MKRGDLVRCWFVAALFVIVVFALARTGSAQDETQTPREAVEQKQPTTISSFTIYPVPNYGGGFWVALLSHGGLGWAQVKAGRTRCSVRIQHNPNLSRRRQRRHEANRKVQRPNRYGDEAGHSKTGALAGRISLCRGAGAIREHGEFLFRRDSSGQYFGRYDRTGDKRDHLTAPLLHAVFH